MIQQFPPTDPSKRHKGSSNDVEADIRWSDLPHFSQVWADWTGWQDWRRTSDLQEGIEMLERYDSTRQQRLAAEDRAITAALRGQAWRNAKYKGNAAIEAILVASGVRAVPLDWGYETICNALEDSGSLLEMEVPAAKQWLIVAGKQIYGNGSGGGGIERLGCILRNYRDLWEGQEGMSRERWEFRKRRLECIQGQKVDEATKETVREAAAAMQAIDGQ